MSSRQAPRIARDQIAAKAQSAKIYMAKVRADEDAAITVIPPAIMARLEDAQKEIVTKGGCPSCGSEILAVHSIPCPATDGDLY